jgi:hypothetical protein
MNTSENPSQSNAPKTSSEAMVGIGITIAGLGLLCLLLALAQYFRSVHGNASIWLAIGIVLIIAGGLATSAARAKNRQP